MCSLSIGNGVLGGCGILVCFLPLCFLCFEFFTTFMGIKLSLLAVQGALKMVDSMPGYV